MGPPSSYRISRVPHYSSSFQQLPFRVRGYHPLSLIFPDDSTNITVYPLWATPLSLAATQGISVDFFSYRYLDVSVPYVRLINLSIQLMMMHSHAPGFPIRTSTAITLLISLPSLFAD